MQLVSDLIPFNLSTEDISYNDALKACTKCLTPLCLLLYCILRFYRIRLTRARINGYVNEVVVNYTEQSFQRCFRMSKTTFETIFEFMKDCPEFHVRQDHGGRQAIPIKHQLLMTLWYFGSRDTIHKITDRFGVSQYSVLSSRDKVIEILLRSLKRKFINWPDANERRVISDYFEMRNGFPGIGGCLDGTHIKISAPSDNPKSYVNRKGYHSIQQQATCRENMTFTHCFTGYPGSCPSVVMIQEY